MLFTKSTPLPRVRTKPPWIYTTEPPTIHIRQETDLVELPNLKNHESPLTTADTGTSEESNLFNSSKIFRVFHLTKHYRLN